MCSIPHPAAPPRPFSFLTLLAVAAASARSGTEA
jgi:hypothetical protein